MRGLVSITLMAIFLVVALSGIIMHIPAHDGQHNNGALEYDTDNFVLKRLHEWAGYLLIILGVVHLVLNRKPMLMHVGWKK